MIFYAHYRHIGSYSNADRVNKIEADSISEAANIAREKKLSNYVFTKILTWEELVEQEPGWAHTFKWKESLNND